MAAAGITSSLHFPSFLLSIPPSNMRLVVLVSAVLLPAVLAQLPQPCATPLELTMRSTQLDHKDDVINRFLVVYDANNKRKAIFEEQDIVVPGRQFHEYLILNNANVMYDINLKTRECTKSVPRPWRPFAIPPNATFENEFYLGGPPEQVYVQEWSDRIPFRQRETWIGQFTLKDCYPVKEILVEGDFINATITSDFYDVALGISDPSVFIPPSECNKAKFGPTTLKYYW